MLRGSSGYVGARSALFDCKASEDSYKMWEMQQLGQRPDPTQLASHLQSYHHPKHRRNRISLASRDDSSSPNGPELPIDVERSSASEDRKLQSHSTTTSSTRTDSTGIPAFSNRAADQDKENKEVNPVEQLSTLPLKERLQAKRRKSIPSHQVDIDESDDAELSTALPQRELRTDAHNIVDLDARPDSRNKARAKQQAKEKASQKKVQAIYTPGSPVKADEDEVSTLKRKLEEANRAREEAAAEKERALQAAQKAKEKEAAEKRKNEKVAGEAAKLQKKIALEQEARERAEEELQRQKDLAAAERRNKELREKLALEQAAREKAEEELRRRNEQAQKKAEEEKRRQKEQAHKKAEEEKRRQKEQAQKKVEEDLRKQKEQAQKKAEEELRKQKEQAQKKAEEEARRLQEQAQKKAEEEARRKKEQAQKKAEDLRKQKEQAQQQAEAEARKRQSQATVEEELRREKEQDEQDKKRRRKSVSQLARPSPGNPCSEDPATSSPSAKHQEKAATTEPFFKKQDADIEQLSTELKSLPLKERLMRMRSASTDLFDTSPKSDPAPSLSASGTAFTREAFASGSNHITSAKDSQSKRPSSVDKHVDNDDPIIDDLPWGKPATNKATAKSVAQKQKEERAVEKPRPASVFAATPLRVKGAATKARVNIRSKGKNSQPTSKNVSPTGNATIGAAKAVRVAVENTASKDDQEVHRGVKRPLPKEGPNKTSPKSQCNKIPPKSQQAPPSKTSPKSEAHKTSPQNAPPSKNDSDDGMSLGSLLESSIPGWQGARLRTGKSGAARLGFSPGVRRWPLSRKPPNAEARAHAAPPPAPKPAFKPAEETFAPPPENMNERESAAYAEILRILRVRKDTFKTASAWGCAVLNVQSTDLAGVQQGYRKLMQKLHPDKVGHLPHSEKAVATTREAKELCERTMSRQVPPGVPRNLRTSTLCSTKGKRRFKLAWEPPVENETAPVQRYLVNAFDPAYGKALTITILEPDYSEELRRYIRLEELTNFVLSEQELTKMPSLFEQRVATLQVAAANESGTGPWASVKVRMSG